jgi:signal transduction histidine kinase
MNSSKSSEYIKPRARIMRILGDELISSELVAMTELVKNSYDADATRVLIRFTGKSDSETGSIEVLDNGHGMDLNTIRGAWLEPAASTKRTKRRSPVLKRRMLGEKGIGRFAAARLATEMIVVSRVPAEEYEALAFFDWTQFDDDDLLLQDVQVLTESRPAKVLTEKALIEYLSPDEREWFFDNGPFTSGTKLEMKPVRKSWSDDSLRSLYHELSRLVSPSFDVDNFAIYLDLPERFAEFAGPIDRLPLLKHPHYEINGSVDSQGNYEFELTGEFLSEQSLTGRFKLNDGESPECGSIKIEFRIWDRDRLDSLAQSLSLSLKQVREDLDTVAGISIYRDGFRVLPYGEPQNDWLRLDLRRLQNPTMRLSNNQLVGYISIGADSNPALRDQSNREGLMADPAFDDLRELIFLILDLVEQPRYKARRPNVIGTGSSGGPVKPMFSEFDLTPVADLVNVNYKNDHRLLSALKTAERNISRGVERVQEIISRYRRLATLGTLIDIVLHDARTPLAKIKNEVVLLIRDLAKAGQESPVDKRLELISRQVELIAKVFQRIEPFGTRKRGRPSRVSLEKVIANAFDVLSAEIVELGATVNLPVGDTEVKVDASEIEEVLINLLQNSLYWLRSVPKGARTINVSIEKPKSGELEIIFSDSGPGVSAENRDLIFDPYFSTKPNGVGLGLSIAGEIITDYYGGELSLMEAGPLSGATFKILLRKRV